MNEEQLRAAIQQAITEKNITAINELTPLLQEQVTQRERQVIQRERAEKVDQGGYVASESFGRKDLQGFQEGVANVPQDFKRFAKEQVFATTQGDIGAGQALFNIAAKGGFDALNTVVSEAIPVLSKNAMVQIFPNAMEEYVANKVINTMTPLIDNPVTKKGLDILSGPAGFVRDSWVNFKNKNPNDAATIEGVVNVAEWLKPPALRNPVPDTSSSLLGKASDKIYESGRKIKTKADRDFLFDLSRPVETTEILREQAKTKTVNNLGTLSVVPTADQEEIISNLLELNLTKGLSFAENGQTISKAVEAKHKALDRKLKKSKVKLNKKELLAELKEIADNLQTKNPALVGDAEASANKIFNLVESLVNKSDGSAKSILDVRRQIDTELTKLGKGNWDGNKQNGIDIASRAMRNHLNLKVAEAVPDINVRKDLRKMHLWLQAHDNVLDKAAHEANLKVGRIVQNIESSTGTKAPSSAISQYVGATLAVGAVSGITLSGYLPIATTIAAAAAIGYAVRRGSVSPNVRKSLAGVLKQADEAIKITKNSTMRKAIAADRAFIVEIMKLPTTKAEDITEEEMEESVQ